MLNVDTLTPNAMLLIPNIKWLLFKFNWWLFQTGVCIFSSQWRTGKKINNQVVVIKVTVKAVPKLWCSYEVLILNKLLFLDLAVCPLISMLIASLGLEQRCDKYHVSRSHQRGARLCRGVNMWKWCTVRVSRRHELHDPTACATLSGPCTLHTPTSLWVTPPACECIIMQPRCLIDTLLFIATFPLLSADSLCHFAFMDSRLPWSQ